jgi:hypothetical protein
MKRRTVVLLVSLTALVVFGLYMRGIIGFQNAPTAVSERRGGSPGRPGGTGGRRNAVIPVLAEAVRTADVPV